MKAKIIYEPVYKFDLVFITDSNLESANKYLKRKNLPLVPESFVNNSGIAMPISEENFPKAVKGYCYCIWIKDKKDFYCLLHEVIHMVVDVFEAKGLQIDTHKSSQEAFAYYVEYWFKILWRFMSKK